MLCAQAELNSRSLPRLRPGPGLRHPLSSILAYPLRPWPPTPTETDTVWLGQTGTPIGAQLPFWKAESEMALSRGQRSREEWGHPTGVVQAVPVSSRCAPWPGSVLSEALFSLVKCGDADRESVPWVRGNTSFSDWLWGDRTVGTPKVHVLRISFACRTLMTTCPSSTSPSTPSQ